MQRCDALVMDRNITVDKLKKIRKVIGNYPLFQVFNHNIDNLAIVDAVIMDNQVSYDSQKEIVNRIKILRQSR